MTRSYCRFAVALAALVSLGPVASAQFSTKNIPISGGTGLTGSLGGNLSAQILSQSSDPVPVQTGGALFITDLDLDLDGSGVVPNGGVQNATASAPITLPIGSSINISIPQQNFGSSLDGSISVTAGDNRANGVVGAFDVGVPGSDGAWDDPGQTGILNNGVVNSSTITTNSPINASANVSGGLNFGIGNDLLIPDVIDNTFVNASFRLKDSSSFGITLDNAQNISLQNLSIATTTPVALNTAGSNFVEAAHPSGVPQLDLSTGGGDLVETVISGSIVADLAGSITGNVDLAADLTVIGFIPFTIDFDNVLDGTLSDPGTSLFQLNESISLVGQELPFLFSVLHEATADVDFDDVIAELRAGTLGIPIPFQVTEEVILPLSGLDFSIENQQFSFDVEDPLLGIDIGGGDATVDLDASLGGNIVFELDADVTLALDVVAEAFEANAINVFAIPEPTSGFFLACAGIAAGAISRRRRA